MASDKEIKYYKCEYENLRRKKNKQIDDLNMKILRFIDKTWKLLKLLGMSDKEIFEWYRKDNDGTKNFYRSCTNRK